MCAVSYDYNEDGSVTAYYYNSGDKPIDYNDTRPKETKHYTHEEVVDGGIIVW